MMKKIYTIITIVLLTATVFAQAPEKMSYQAVVRDASDKLVTSTSVGMQISILQGSATGTAVYVETQTPTTNVNGLVTVEIGTGTTSDDFSAIDWANDIYFIKTETDPAGGTSYTITGTSQLLSVPYALQSKNAENGITTAQANEITANTLKVGYTDALVSANTDVVANTAKVGITTAQANEITANTLKVGYTDALVSANTDVVANTLKVGYTDALVSANTDVVANTLKVGYTDALVSANTDVAANTAKVGVTAGTTRGQMQYWNGTAWVTVARGSSGQVLTFVNGVPTWGVSISAGTDEVQNPITGAIWMDRNLGATQVATSSTDAASYGDLYQWGRDTDGHQIRTSATTNTLSSADVPGHGNFISPSSSPWDWRSPQNINLWQGVNGVNNPCPTSYRIPTDTELDAERASWSSQNAAGAFASPLKLPAAGRRDYDNGLLFYVGSYGYYWSSTVDGTDSHFLHFYSSSAYLNSYNRAYGFSVRCIKD